MRNSTIKIFSDCEQFLLKTVQGTHRAHLDPQFIGVKPIASAAHVTTQTVRRWLRGEQAPDAAALHLLRLNTYGLVLPEKDWPEFRFRGGYLWFGDKYYANAIDLRRYFLNY